MMKAGASTNGSRAARHSMQSSVVGTGLHQGGMPIANSVRSSSVTSSLINEQIAQWTSSGLDRSAIIPSVASSQRVANQGK